MGNARLDTADFAKGFAEAFANLPFFCVRWLSFGIARRAEAACCKTVLRAEGGLRRILRVCERREF